MYRFIRTKYIHMFIRVEGEDSFINHMARYWFVCTCSFFLCEHLEQSPENGCGIPYPCGTERVDTSSLRRSCGCCGCLRKERLLVVREEHLVGVRTVHLPSVTSSTFGEDEYPPYIRT